MSGTPAKQVVNKLDLQDSILTTCEADLQKPVDIFVPIEGLKYCRLYIGNTHARRVDNAISKKAVNKKDPRA